MASSRLEKIGNIYTRITGLLRSGAMEWPNRPLFYDIYTAFPPLREHKYKEDAPNVEVRQIFYEEDKERATKDYSNMLAFEMNEKNQSRSDLQFRQHKVSEKPLVDNSNEKIFDMKSLDFNNKE